MNEDCQAPKEKKSLINSIEKLTRKMARLKDLQELSYGLLNKMKHPFPAPDRPDVGIDEQGKENIESPGVVDAFDRISDRIGILIAQTEDNIREVFNMVG